MKPGSVLTRRALNRAVLARQLLLERSPDRIPRALERVAGIQAQYAPSMYVGLWSRLAELERAGLTAALERRTVVQATLMRSTIHLVSRADYWPLALAVRDARRTSWRRAWRGAPADAEMQAAAGLLRERLVSGPLHRREIEALVGKTAAAGVGLWIDLVRVPPSGTWERRRADVYALAEAWLGTPDGTAEDGLELLVRRYLGGFGPASRADIASWTGLPPRTVASVLDRVALRRFRDEAGAELFDLPGAPRPDPATPAPVRFLPTWDATLLVHARRAGILAEEHRPLVFSTRNPHSVPTFLVDGTAAGTWRHEDGRIRVEPWAPLDAATRREVDAEANRLAAFHA